MKIQGIQGVSVVNLILVKSISLAGFGADSNRQAHARWSAEKFPQIVETRFSTVLIRLQTRLAVRQKLSRWLIVWVILRKWFVNAFCTMCAMSHDSVNIKILKHDNPNMWCWWDSLNNHFPVPNDIWLGLPRENFDHPKEQEITIRWSRQIGGNPGTGKKIGTWNFRAGRVAGIRSMAARAHEDQRHDFVIPPASEISAGYHLKIVASLSFYRFPGPCCPCATAFLRIMDQVRQWSGHGEFLSIFPWISMI